MSRRNQRNWYDAAGDHMRTLGTSPENWTNRVVVAAALKHGVQVTFDSDRNRILLTHEGRRHWWRDGLGSLNTRLAMRVSKNKDVLSAFLRAHGVPTLENQTFRATECDRAWEWGNKFASLVIKPTDGTGGVGVHVDLRTEEEFKEAFGQVAKISDRILVEEFQSGQEYRFLVVQNRVIAVAQRRPAQVLGDGRRNIRQLVAAKNDARWRAASHKQLRLDHPELEHLREQGLTPESVPAVGQVSYLRATSNIHTGGDAVDVTDEIAPTHIEQVEAAAKVLFGGRVLGFDVLISPGKEVIGIIEVNTGPMVSMHHLPWEGTPRNVGEAIISAMFPTVAAPGAQKRRDWRESPQESAQGSRDVRPPSGVFRRRLRRIARRVLRRAEA